MSLPHILGVGAGLIGGGAGTYLGVKAGSALERRLSPDEKDAVEGAITTVIPAAKVFGPPRSPAAQVATTASGPDQGGPGSHEASTA